MPQRTHFNELLEEMMSLFETNLKVSLSLNGIYRGDLRWLPPRALGSMINGIWINMERTTDVEEVALPRCLEVLYRFRVVYVRRLDTTNNPVDVKIDDMKAITDVVYDNYQLSGLTLSNGQVLWWLPRTMEPQPAEDEFASAFSSDLVAVAFDTECLVRTKIS